MMCSCLSSWKLLLGVVQHSEVKIGVVTADRSLLENGILLE